MEPSEFIVVQPCIIEDQNMFNDVKVYVNSDAMTEEFVDSQALLETEQELLENVLEDSDTHEINIKLEDVDVGPEVIITPNFNTASDECVAVEALSQLSNSSEKQFVDNIDPDLIGGEITEGMERNYACQLCHSKFNLKKVYLKHLVSHSISRPHSCINCGALFHLKKDLHEHMTVHGTNHTSSCSFCNRSFTRTSAFINHLKMHNSTQGRAKKHEQISAVETLAELLTSEPTNIQTVVVKTEPDIKPIKVKPIKIEPDINWVIENTESIHCTDKAELPDQQTNGPKLSKGKYKCNHCSILFKRETALVSHIRLNHQPSDDHLCMDCDIYFSSAAVLEEHLEQCSKNKQSMKTPFSAPKTSSFDPQESFDESKQCKKCDKRFVTKQKLMQHVWVHRKKRHKCNECEQYFDTVKALDYHRLNDHKTKGKYACMECGMNYCSNQGLSEHKARVHQKGNGMVMYYCEVCDKSFSGRQGFHIHKRIHSGERPYGCKYCTKSFRDGSTLRRHELIHTGERPHVCPVCQKGFIQKVGLREHVRWLHAATSNAKGLFTCSICLQNCPNQDELTVHLIYHSDKMARAFKEDKPLP